MATWLPTAIAPCRIDIRSTACVPHAPARTATIHVPPVLQPPCTACTARPVANYFAANQQLAQALASLTPLLLTAAGEPLQPGPPPPHVRELLPPWLFTPECAAALARCEPAALRVGHGLQVLQVRG